MDQDIEDEYRQLMRGFFHNFEVPAGYIFVSSREPGPVLQNAYEMTLARGHKLHEIVDNWTLELKGYVVPVPIYSLALDQREGPSLDSWSKLSFHDRTMRCKCYNRILKDFPRIPPFSAKIITERMVQERRDTTSRRKTEENIVNYIRHCYTSYEFRLQMKLQDKDDVLEMIKPRMRKVLERWLPAFYDGTELVRLWKRHHLLDDEKGDGKFRESELCYKVDELTWYGGKEIMGNIRGDRMHARI